MEGVVEREGEGGGERGIKAEEKKRGRPKEKKTRPEEESQKEQEKFFVDVADDHSARDMINKLLAEANNKVLGRKIILKDLVLASLPKLTSKDIESIQNNSLTNMERIEKQRLEYNQKNKTNLDLGEYLVSVRNLLKEDRNAK